MKQFQKEIEKLRDDANYYGKFGSKYLSNSNIKDLIENPAAFGKESETTLPMLHGRYFHTAILEPEKLSNFKVVDASTRNTKIYKDATIDECEPIMLLHEKNELDLAVNEIIRLLGDDLLGSDGVNEEPMIKEIGGLLWKGKADRILRDKKIIDIKTSADITKFSRSAYNYNYDSQAYIYNELFGLPLEFYVVCKKTLQVKIFKCSEAFLDRGAEKVGIAVREYNKFFGPNAIENVNNYVPTITL